MSSETTEPTQKYEELKERTLFGVLDAATQEFILEVCSQYRMTFQEFRWLTEVARDLQMWHEAPLCEWWNRLDQHIFGRFSQPQRKKLLLSQLSDQVKELKRSPKTYPAAGLPSPTRSPFKVVTESTNKQIVGDCPVASEKTVCCNLKTIDASENCAFGCSYCTIQTFYGDNVVVDGQLREKLQNIRIDPQRFYHFGTGQSSDSLLLGNRDGMLDSLCEFADRHPNVLLEFKTKSANVTYFLANRSPRNIVCSWSLNTDTMIDNEEHFTAGLDERLAAARKVADRGVKVAFHFHPIVYYDNWQADYRSLVGRVLKTFRAHEVLFVSFGSVTLIKPVAQAIRKRGEPTRILQMEMVPDPHGKLSYPDDVKLQLFHTMYGAFRPWHGSVFMYLCMERDYFWHQVFGRCYATNDEFEADFGARTMTKLRMDASLRE